MAPAPYLAVHSPLDLLTEPRLDSTSQPTSPSYSPAPTHDYAHDSHRTTADTLDPAPVLGKRALAASDLLAARSAHGAALHRRSLAPNDTQKVTLGVIAAVRPFSLSHARRGERRALTCRRPRAVRRPHHRLVERPRHPLGPLAVQGAPNRLLLPHPAMSASADAHPSPHSSSSSPFTSSRTPPSAAVRAQRSSRSRSTLARAAAP